MKRLRAAMLQRRAFFLLLALTLPFVMGQTDCNPAPDLTCDQNIYITVERNRCSIIYPPCQGFDPWRLGDSFSYGIGGVHSQQALRNLGLQKRISSNNAILRRICAYYTYSQGSFQRRYEYTHRNTNYGTGNIFISMFSEGLFSVSLERMGCRNIDRDCSPYNAASLNIFGAFASGGTAPYSYAFTANGIPVTDTAGDTFFHTPTHNTEYRVTVTDNTGAQAAAIYIMKADNQNQPDPTFTATPSGTISTNQTVTLTPASAGGMTPVEWQWDMDWLGNDDEPFEQTINTGNGVITKSWQTPGTKYIRLRTRDAQGNFGETFLAVRVA